MESSLSRDTRVGTQACIPHSDDLQGRAWSGTRSLDGTMRLMMGQSEE